LKPFQADRGAPKEEEKMDTAVVRSSKPRARNNRAYASIVMVLFGAGMLWALASLSRDTSAQVGAKGAGGAQPASGVSDTLDCGPDWNVVSSPNSGDVSNLLNGVAAISANDVWAVGSWESVNGEAPYHTLALHWDGSIWSVVTTPPNIGTYDNLLYGLAAVATNDVWAVGNYYYSATEVRTLILHWDGSIWSIIPSPNQGTYSSYLYGVAAISANDVWAVGTTTMEAWTGR
jgi:hypothetical protein